MNRAYLNFLTTLYHTTRGYLPFWPMDTAIKIGDLMVLSQGKMIRIGNIMDMNISNSSRIKISPPQYPLKQCWSIKDGVKFSLKSERNFVENDEVIYTQKQRGILMEFEFAGAFFFQSNEVFCRSIINFHDFSFQLLQFLASEQFSFREIYVITSTAYIQNLALAISAEKGGRMFVSLPQGQKVTPFMSTLINSDLDWDIDHASGVEDIQFTQLDETIFFKAKKMEVSTKGREKALAYLLNNLSEAWMEHLFNIENFTLMDMLPSSEIYPASVHEYFHFRDLNQNDIYNFLNG